MIDPLTSIIGAVIGLVGLHGYTWKSLKDKIDDKVSLDQLNDKLLPTKIEYTHLNTQIAEIKVSQRELDGKIDKLIEKSKPCEHCHPAKYL